MGVECRERVFVIVEEPSAGQSSPRGRLMSTKKAATKTAVAVLETADRPEKIRNVALVGHSAGGKTTLVESLLAATGTITRAGPVAEGTTVGDSDPVALRPLGRLPPRRIAERRLPGGAASGTHRSYHQQQRGRDPARPLSLRR